MTCVQSWVAGPVLLQRMLCDGWFNYLTTIPAIWSSLAQQKHCTLNILDQLLTCPQIKYIMLLIALQLCPQCFILKSAGPFIRPKGYNVCLHRKWRRWFRSSGCGQSTVYVSSAEKASFPPLPSHFFSPFPAKWFRTDGTTTFVFSDSLDSTCWWNGAFTLYCPCRCVAVRFLMQPLF